MPPQYFAFLSPSQAFSFAFYSLPITDPLSSSGLLPPAQQRSETQWSSTDFFSMVAATAVSTDSPVAT
jgi:hypothetical protein